MALKPNHSAIVNALNFAKKGEIDYGLCDPEKMSTDFSHYAGLDDDGTQTHSLPLIYNGKLNAGAVDKAMTFAKDGEHDDLAAALGHVADAIDAHKKAQLDIDDDDNGAELLTVDADDADAMDADVSDDDDEDDLVDDDDDEEDEDEEITDDTTPAETQHKPGKKLSAKTLPARVSLRSMDIAKGAKPTVDREGNGAIRNVSVMQKGPALGHGFMIDDTMLDQVASQMKNGSAMRFTHPEKKNDDGSTQPIDSLGTHVGRVTNIRREPDELRGDIEFGPHAKKVPGMGDVSGYLMDLADSDPSAFGLSTVFEPDDYDVDPQGNPLGRSKNVAACDLTGDPASNPNGLL